MDDDLRAVLEAVHRDASEAQVADAEDAESARAAGEMPRYFDLSIHLELADVSWALRLWDEARQWYRHNADVMMEKRAWHADHSGPDYPLDATSDWEAATLVKAGDLDRARQHLPRAIAYWQGRSGSDLVLSRLGLHAAQAGLTDLAPYAGRIVAARQELPGDRDDDAERARALLHYEPAEVSLLLGGWEPFLAQVERLQEGVRIVEGTPVLAFPPPLQDALVAAARGLALLASLGRGEIEPQAGRNDAQDAFEAAMLGFHRFSGQIDWHLYFMAMNIRFADELAAGQVIDPNPFAAGANGDSL